VGSKEIRNMSMTGLAFLIAATSYAGELAVLPAPHVSIAIGYHLVGRQLEPVERDHVFIEGDRVTAWTAVVGVPAGFIEHVWSRDGVEVARQVLPVGSGRRWRSWSRHTVKPGSYEVRIIGPDGSVLARTRFEVAELEEDC
jgi:hypothetical protein